MGAQKKGARINVKEFLKSVQSGDESTIVGLAQELVKKHDEDVLLKQEVATFKDIVSKCDEDQVIDFVREFVKRVDALRAVEAGKGGICCHEYRKPVLRHSGTGVGAACHEYTSPVVTGGVGAACHEYTSPVVRPVRGLRGFPHNDACHEYRTPRR